LHGPVLRAGDPIDTNFGALLRKLDEWGIEKNTLVIYIGGDNGGTAGCGIHNAGLRGSKGSVYQGGTRAAAFFRWPDRLLVHHVGRWGHGKAAESKYAKCAIQDARFTLVDNKELYDLEKDPGAKSNVIDEHPEVVTKLRAAYDRWWEETLPLMVSENARGPKINPFKKLCWKQFGGGPDAALLRGMDPEKESANERKGPRAPKEKRRDGNEP
jgi:arylsulfatase